MELEKSILASESPAERICTSRDEHGWGDGLKPRGLGSQHSKELCSDESYAPWPEGHPLPLPQWGPPKEPLTVTSVEEYEELAATVEHTVQQVLQTHQYNTVGNFIRFYEEFKRTGETKLSSFFRSYSPPITSDHYTCVGLGLELLRRLEGITTKFPKAAGKFYLISCEEAIDHLQDYIGADPCVGTCEKEHVLVALRILIEDRSGVLLLDPGYHVARAVTVMKDGIYPHTGWFSQSEEPKLRKEYCYTLSDNYDYVVWTERETRNGVESISESVVYIARPYLTPINVTERRNLVYNFRSWLARDTKGHLLAGMYFPVKEGAEITIFYQDSAFGKQRVRFSPSSDLDESPEINMAVRRCSAHLGLSFEEMETIFFHISTITTDRSFLRDTLDINRDINGISMEN